MLMPLSTLAMALIRMLVVTVVLFFEAQDLLRSGGCWGWFERVQSSSMELGKSPRSLRNSYLRVGNMRFCLSVLRCTW